jgi:MOSC domain-containing protein YiiM
MTGVILQISLSNGGVPKRAIDSGIVWEGGLQGDRQADLRAHGGPARAVCLYSFEVLRRRRVRCQRRLPGGARTTST